MLYITSFLTAYFTVIAFVLGAVLASFLGCLGWRMCNGESVLKGRSHCDSCGHVLGARDLIPIFSYLISKGRCRYCGVQISPVNLYGELILGILFAVVTFLYGHPFQYEYILVLFFFCIMYLVTVTDMYEQIIPDSAIVVAIVVKLVHLVIGYYFDLNYTLDHPIVYIEKPALWSELFAVVIDGLAVSVPLLILVLIMEKILGKEAMGGGDIKLIFVTGMYLGWARNILVIFFACIIGIFIASLQQKSMQQGEEMESEEETFYFPFGPSIALSAVLVLFIGNPIIDWYLSLF